MTTSSENESPAEQGKVELKPCPFCGGAAYYERGEVLCADCTCTGPAAIHDGGPTAETLWNERRVKPMAEERGNEGSMIGKRVEWDFACSPRETGGNPVKGSGIAWAIGFDSGEDTWQDFVVMVELDSGELATIPRGASNLRVLRLGGVVMAKVLSDDKRDPHRYDPSPRNRCPSDDRGWRIRSDLYHGYYLDKAGVRIEELEARVAELETKLRSIAVQTYTVNEGRDGNFIHEKCLLCGVDVESGRVVHRTGCMMLDQGGKVGL